MIGKKILQQKNLFIRVEMIRKLIKDKFGSFLTDTDIRKTISRLRGNIYLGTKLKENDAKIGEFLKINGLKISSIYSWFHETIVPDDVKHMVFNNGLSLKRAKRIYRNKTEQEKAILTLDILEKGRNAIRRL